MILLERGSPNAAELERGEILRYIKEKNPNQNFSCCHSIWCRSYISSSSVLLMLEVPKYLQCQCSNWRPLLHTRQAEIRITYAGGTQILVFIFVKIIESKQETATYFSSVNASLMMTKITVIVILDLAVCFCAEFVNYNVDQISSRQ